MGALVAAALALAAASPGAAPGQTNLGCGSGKLLLSVSYRVQNDVDTSVKGNNWAFDAYTRVVRVWRKAPGRFCSASTYRGEFTSIAGWSPGGRTAIPADIRGTFRGSSTTTFRGTFAPGSSLVRGALGLKDFMCSTTDEKGQCRGTWDWLRTYFTGIDRFTYLRYAFTYHATENGKGTWTDTFTGGKVRLRASAR